MPCFYRGLFVTLIHFIKKTRAVTGFFMKRLFISTSPNMYKALNFLALISIKIGTIILDGFEPKTKPWEERKR